jgi:tetratricopeptide (TPR) repeat protein
MSNNRQKPNLLACLMAAVTLLPSIAYASYFLQQPIMGQSHNDFDHLYKGNSILNKISLSDIGTLLSNEGNKVLGEGKYNEAIMYYYDKALPMDPNSSTSVLTNKGVALCNLGRSEEAIEYFDRVLTIDPNYDRAINTKHLILDAINKRNTTSTTELSLNNKTDYNNNITTNVINTIDNNTTTNFLTYQNSTYSITIRYPSDWVYIGHNTILQPLSQPIVTFTPIEPSDSTLVRIWITPLTVKVEERKPSLNQIAERTIQLDQQSLSDFKLNESKPITLKDGTAAHMLSYIYIDPDFGMTDALDILMIKGNNLYAIEYFAEPQIYPFHLPKFQTMLDSFKVSKQ